MIFLGIGVHNYDIHLPFLDNSTTRGYYSFFFGLLLYKIINKIKNINLMAAFSFLVLVVCTILFKNYTEFMRDTSYILTYIYFPALIILFKSKLFTKVFNREFIGKLGQISFDVYLWHVPLLMLMFIVIKIFNLNINLSSYFSMACFVIICFIFGALSHFFIELPCNKIIKKITTD